MKTKSRSVALLFLMTLCGCRMSPAKEEIHLYIWTNYIQPAILEEFEKQEGIRVVVDYYASNEELLAKLEGGAAGYDVIVPSDYMVSIMVRRDILARMDRSKLPNFKNLDPRFLGLYYDPSDGYSVPYAWGVTGIAYDAEAVQPPPQGWGIFWDERYKGRMSLLNDQREVFAMALQHLGYPVSSQDPAQIGRARDALKTQKKLVRTYSSESYERYFLTGDVVLAHAWSPDIHQIVKEKPSVRFVIPKEGGIIWTDNLCIPAGSKKQEQAHRLINYLLQPEVTVRIVRNRMIGCLNRAAYSLLPEELRKDPTIVPQNVVLKRLAWMQDVGPALPLYDRAWTELKVE